MSELLGSRIAGGNTAYNRSAADFYPTPPDVTYALLDFLASPAGAKIWEPACGQGHMVKAMEQKGYSVIGTDLSSGTDFLECAAMPCDWIITNPPFSLADKFIERCAQHGKPFALLLKSQYWHAKKRLAIFKNTPPTYICPLTWRPDFMFGQRGSGSPLMDVMWCVWGERGFTQYLPLERPKMEETK